MRRVTITNVQLLRLIAASAILFSHTADLLLSRTSWIWSFPWAGGVDLFFVISGFIMTWLTQGQFGEDGAAGGYLVRRIIRIVPPYWFFTGLMTVTVIMFGQHVRNTTIEPVRIATSFAFIPWPRHDGGLNPILSQGWTLNYEMFFYVCFSLALFCRRGLLFLVCGFFALAAIHPMVPDGWFVLRFYSEPIILEFLGGIAIGQLYLRGFRVSGFGALACCLASASSYALFRSIGEEQRVLVIGMPALLFAAGLILRPEPRRTGLAMRLMILGGDASYTLYLSHTFTVNAVILTWQAMVDDRPVGALVVALVIAMAVAIAIYRLAEAPMTAWLGQLSGRPVARGPASVAP